MIDDIYSTRIIELAGNIGRVGRLAAPDATAHAFSRLCGSSVTVDLRMEDGRVVDFAHEVKACALGQAASAIMAEAIIGATAEELRAVRLEMLKMLKQEGAPPEGRFAACKYLEPVRAFRARHGSTMLPFEAVVDCLDQIDARDGQGH